ncbi:MAG TPA: prolipoprotein diacylglyceryl transferase [Acidimicrobiales bacterium]|jgi:prolipoprotein diacylglyceryl transferase|nr:prolipoprotein diacylglyceryl transferase [Acidimicrobiales bacterium]
MVGYIPSPSTNGFNIGPLRLHAYGFLIVLGVFAAVWLADRRWRAWGGEPGTFSNIAVWGVPGGLIGARLYSVITDYELYDHHLIGIVEIWKGGLGIWGGIAGGVFGGWLYIRRHHLDFGKCLDCVAPALPLAQAIGRWGNYFNQELFGRPTKLPWGLKIDPTIVARLFSNVNKPVPASYLHATAFQPTFLYESLWDIAVVLLVLWVEKHVRLRKGYLFWTYAALYTFGRFFTEYLRIDFAHKILGLRLNDWTSIIVFAVSILLVVTRGIIREPSGAPPGERGEGVQPDRARSAVTVGIGGSTSGPPTAAAGDTLDEEDIGTVFDRRHDSSLVTDLSEGPDAPVEPTRDDPTAPEPPAASETPAATETPAAEPSPVEPSAAAEPGLVEPAPMEPTPVEPVATPPVATERPPEEGLATVEPDAPKVEPSPEALPPPVEDPPTSAP